MSFSIDRNPVFAHYVHPEHIVSATWLSARLGSPKLKVVECDENSLLYDTGHIPTALRVEWDKDLTDPTIRDVISPHDFATFLGSRGITYDDTVVIYGDASNARACFALWVFHYYGHPDVRLLDGGRDAWMSEERDSSFAVPKYSPVTYPIPQNCAQPIRARVADIHTHIDEYTIIDVRSPDAFAGTVASPTPGMRRFARSGHIPGAVNIPWFSAVLSNGCFRPLTDLTRIYGSLRPQHSTVVYCNDGSCSAHTWFVLKNILGFDDVRNYDGSWLEWGNMIANPITRTDS